MAELTGCRCILPAPYDRAEWLKVRNTGIGGSDAAAVLGMNPWKSAYELWLEKRGETPAGGDDPQLGPNDPRYWGLLLEDDVAEAFEDTTGLRTVVGVGLLASDNDPWMLASPDRFVYDGGELVGLLEMKTTGQFRGHEWRDDEVPLGALVQVHHYLMVTGLPRAWIAGLIGGQQFVCKEVEPDPELHKLIRESETFFWDMVRDGVAPHPDGSKHAAEAIRRRWPQATDDDDGVVLSPDEYADVRRIRELTHDIKKLVIQKDALSQRLMDRLGDHAAGYYNDNPVVRWSNVTTKRLDQSALRAHHPEIADLYVREYHSRRFSVVGKD